MKASFLGHLLESIADKGRDILPYSRQTRSGKASDRKLFNLCKDLLSQKGEASGVVLAREAIDLYGTLSAEQKLSFLKSLASDFDPDADDIVEAAATYRERRDVDSLERLIKSVEPERQELFRRLNLAPGGTAFLVKMRSELLDLMKHEPALAVIDMDLEHLFGSWFNRGFLVLERISWQTPANILEKLIDYEAVHEIRGWDDLRRRLAGDRRCYAFFHPALVDEPLIFVEIALLDQISDQIEGILDTELEPADPKSLTTAVFYSISNCQDGLRGISFGNFLIKQVVEELKKELPNLTRFVTLSPVPGLRAWLESEAGKIEGSLLSDDERQLAIELKDHVWGRDMAADDDRKPQLLRLAAHYLMTAKAPANGPLDPVARFHLGNGARLERVNWMADASTRAIHDSYGIMANYAYLLDQIERNHEMFTNEGEIVASRAVRSLAPNH